MHRDASATQWRSLTLLALAAAVFLLLLHPYRGLTHDAQLYTIQALNQLHPQLYGHDIFLRYGSQDDYTVFSSLHAWTISWLGFEPAAAVLTLFSLLLFLAAFWMLARRVLPAPQAAIALLLVVMVPAHYGPMRVFHYIEEFVTPRLLAEALTLFCLAAWLAGKRVRAAALGGAAMLVHPIMGLAGIVFIAVLEWIAPQWRRLWPLAVLGAGLAALALAGWLPLTRWQFDPEWYRIAVEGKYLELANWTDEDWGRVATLAATLAIARITLDNGLRRMATVTLVTMGLMLVLAFIGGDLLRIVIVVQAQIWRALWLATVVAILLLAPVFGRGWHAGPLNRCALLMLAAAWAEPYFTLALVAAPLAVLCTALASRPLQARTGQLLLWGSWTVLGVAIVHGLAVTALTWHSDMTVVGNVPMFLQKLILLGANGVIPALLALTGGWLIWRFPSRRMAAALSLAAAAALVALLYPMARTWASSDPEYGNAAHEAFHAWRALVPEGSEVLWVEPQPGNAAMNAWLLLQRPSFISAIQAPNALFSREAAIEMSRRATALQNLLPFRNPFYSPQAPRPARPFRLAPVCALGVRYVVTDENLVDATPIPAPASAPAMLRQQKLYLCP